MKGNLKTYFTKALIMCALTITAISCSKDKEAPTQSPIENKIEAAKLQRIEKFITISFGVPAGTKVYNEVKEEFTINDFKMTRKQMEEVYDRANEYKLNHEK
ncbi:hypothetical protein DBR43_02310 [Pedobacter sp. KBW06]|uniref:hypothetical protein n=1 Tax=Pedobacter sp. KBW06 TaxID=2153359 RepID=UPI000F5A5DCC|nr:hypothetical protein [Pedobacter sp. KBW06]RQO74252.1 hypothetical protein DBR43_02310 [Pedobacter sp. KBW06]